MMRWRGQLCRPVLCLSAVLRACYWPVCRRRLFGSIMDGCQVQSGRLIGAARRVCHGSAIIRSPSRSKATAPSSPPPQHFYRRDCVCFAWGIRDCFPPWVSERRFGQAEAIREGWTCISSARFACRGSVVCRTFCRCAGLQCAGFRFSVLAWSHRPIPCTIPIPVQIDDSTSFSSSSSLLDDT